MPPIVLPDLPAYFCYCLVFLTGLIVSAYNINRLLAGCPGRWAFINTWCLFWVQALVPVVLFWFLDYASALHDTALFAALVVGIGYQQIFTSGVAGIRMPGPTALLWQPFEAWVNSVAAGIFARVKRRSDSFDDNVRTDLARDAKKLGNFKALVYVYADRAKLDPQLAALDVAISPPGLTPAAWDEVQNRKRARILLQEFRAAEPVNYGEYMRRQKLISSNLYWRWLGNARSTVMTWLMVSLMTILLAVSIGLVYRSPDSRLWYYQWRFTKGNASDRDQFRTFEYFDMQLTLFSQSKGQSKPDIMNVLGPLLAELRYREVTAKIVDDILREIVNHHNQGLDALIIPALLTDLRTENADVRLRIHRILQALQKADYPDVTVEVKISEWVPAKEESSAQIDDHVRAWMAWWETAARAKPPMQQS
jgi:hypothetical protein